MNLITIFYIGCGGFVGTVLRYLTSHMIQSYISSSAIATLTVNMIGSLVIGAFLGYGFERLGETGALVIVVGILGGFTTFSAFSAETLLMMKDERWAAAACYIAVMVTGGLLASFLGFWAAQR